MKELIKTVQFKQIFALIVTALCFLFFFLRGVDNGIMVLTTLAVKHYFDSTASAVKNNQTISDAMANKEKK